MKRKQKQKAKIIQSTLTSKKINSNIVSETLRDDNVWGSKNYHDKHNIINGQEKTLISCEPVEIEKISLLQQNFFKLDLQFFGKEEDEAFRTLGLNQEASPEEITKTYRRLALKHHPDKGGSAEKFQEISKAYEILTEESEEKIIRQFETITELKEKLREAEEERTLAAKWGKTLLEQNNQLTEQACLFANQLKNEKDESEEKDRKIISLEHKIESQENEIKGLVGERSNLTDELDNLKRKKQSLEKEVNNYDNENSKSKVERDKLENEIERVNDELIKVKGKIANIQEELIKTKKTLKNKEEELEQNNKIFEGQAEFFAGKEKVIADLTTERNLLKNIVVDKYNELENEKQNWENSLDAIEEEKQDLQGQIKDLEIELRKVKQEKGRLERKIKQNNGSNNERLDRQWEREKEIIDLKTELEQKENEIANLKEEVNFQRRGKERAIRKGTEKIEELQTKLNETWTQWGKTKAQQAGKVVDISFRVFKKVVKNPKLVGALALKAGEVLSYAGTGYAVGYYQNKNVGRELANPHQGIESINPTAPATITQNFTKTIYAEPSTTTITATKTVETNVLAEQNRTVIDNLLKELGILNNTKNDLESNYTLIEIELNNAKANLNATKAEKEKLLNSFGTYGNSFEESSKNLESENNKLETEKDSARTDKAIAESKLDIASREITGWKNKTGFRTPDKAKEVLEKAKWEKDEIRTELDNLRNDFKTKFGTDNPKTLKDNLDKLQKEKADAGANYTKEKDEHTATKISLKNWTDEFGEDLVVAKNRLNSTERDRDDYQRGLDDWKMKTGLESPEKSKETLDKKEARILELERIGNEWKNKTGTDSPDEAKSLLDDAKKQLIDAEIAKTMTENKLKGTEKERDDYRKDIENWQKETGVDTPAKAKEALKKVKNDLTKTKVEKRKVETKQKEAEKALKDLKKDLLDKIEEIKNLIVKNQELSRNVNSLENKITLMSFENNQQTNLKINKLTDRINELEASSKTSEEQKSFLNSTKIELQKDLNLKVIELEDHKIKLTTAERDRDDARIKLEKWTKIFEDDAEVVKSKLDNAINSLNITNDTLTETKDKLVATEKELNSYKDSLQEWISRFRNETASDIDNKLKEKDNKIEKLDQEASDLNDENIKLELGKDDLENKFKSLESDLANIKEEKKELGKTNKILEAGVETLKQKIKSKDQNIKELNDLLDKEKQIVAEKQAEAEKLSSKVIEHIQQKKQTNQDSWTRTGFEIVGASLQYLITNLLHKNEELKIVEFAEKEIQKEKDKTQVPQDWKDNHVCPIINECSHADYEKLKEQLELEKEKLEQQKKHCRREKKKLRKKIISWIITDCHLDLSLESNLGQLVSHLQELLKTPDQVEQKGLNSDLPELQRQLRTKGKIIEELNIKNTDLVKDYNSLQKVNIFLAIILIASWLIVVGLAIKNAKSKKKRRIR